MPLRIGQIRKRLRDAVDADACRHQRGRIDLAFRDQAQGIGEFIRRVAEHILNVELLHDARIVVVGVCMETDRSEPMLGIMKELNVQYVLGYTPDEFAYSLRLIAEGQVDAASLVTARVGIDGVAQAFADLANPETHTKIIVE